MPYKEQIQQFEADWTTRRQMSSKAGGVHRLFCVKMKKESQEAVEKASQATGITAWQLWHLSHDTWYYGDPHNLYHTDGLQGKITTEVHWIEKEQLWLVRTLPYHDVVIKVTDEELKPLLREIAKSTGYLERTILGTNHRQEHLLQREKEMREAALNKKARAAPKTQISFEDLGLGKLNLT